MPFCSPRKSISLQKDEHFIAKGFISQHYHSHCLSSGLQELWCKFVDNYFRGARPLVYRPDSACRAISTRPLGAAGVQKFGGGGVVVETDASLLSKFWTCGEHNSPDNMLDPCVEVALGPTWGHEASPWKWCGAAGVGVGPWRHGRAAGSSMGLWEVPQIYMMQHRSEKSRAGLQDVTRNPMLAHGAQSSSQTRPKPLI